jgi:uncharacterized protein (TIGR00661 family)
MRILYAIQGTGNGHVARATEIVPILKSMADTDVLISGTQADLKVPFQIDYRLKGMSFIFGQDGGVDLFKTVQRMSVLEFFRDIRNLPVKQYDLVINDFEPVSAWSCRFHNKPCIGLSHQNAVLHPSAPQPDFNDFFGKFILKHYAPANFKYGFNFAATLPDIFTPVIRSTIRKAQTERKSHYTVYLPAFSDHEIFEVLSKVPEVPWEVFSKHSKIDYQNGNLHFRPVSLEDYTKSFLSCTGLLCTAGFEGPAEAIFHGKKLCVIPMKRQYEQYCNAAFLKTLGIKVLRHFTSSIQEISHWVTDTEAIQTNYPDQTKDILEHILKTHFPD